MIYRYFIAAFAILVVSCGVILAVSPKIRFVAMVSIFGYGDDHGPPKSGQYKVTDALSDTDLILYYIDDKDYKPSPQNPNWNSAIQTCSNAKIRPEAVRIVIGIYNNNSRTYEDAIEFKKTDFVKGNISDSKYHNRLLRSNNVKNGIDWAF